MKGFLALARARFHAPPAALHFGIGATSFEGRPRAARLRCNVVRWGSQMTYAGAKATLSSESPEAGKSLGVEVDVLPSPKRKPQAAENSGGVKEGARVDMGVDTGEGQQQRMETCSEKHADDADDVSQPTAPDPLRLFGILPPPALRDAQACFERAVCGPVAELVGVLAELARLEGLIEEEKARRKKD